MIQRFYLDGNGTGDQHRDQALFLCFVQRIRTTMEETYAVAFHC
jgi:hypothetical protein